MSEFTHTFVSNKFKSPFMEDKVIKKKRGRPKKKRNHYIRDYWLQLDLMAKYPLRKVSRITKTSTTTLLKLKKMFMMGF